MPLCAAPCSCRPLGWHPWVLAEAEGWGSLTGGRQEVLPRTSPWRGGAGGTPRQVPTCGRPWGPVHPLPVMGGLRKPRIASCVVMLRGHALGPGGCSGGAGGWLWVPWAPVGARGGHLGTGAGGAPTLQPPGSRTPLLHRLDGSTAPVPGAGGGGMRGAGCWRSRGPGGPGGPGEAGGGPGSRCSPNPLPGSVPLSSPRADINSSVFPFPKFPR